MKTTRRNFLKGLLAVGTAALVPQALVEKVHGASDLTPQERDIAADVMGLRRETWAGADLWHPKTMRRTTWPDGARMTDKIDDWSIEHGDLVMFQDAKTELLIDGEWRLVVEPGTTIVGVDSAPLDTWQGADGHQAQRDELHITIKAMDNLSGAMQDTAHAFDNLEMSFLKFCQAHNCTPSEMERELYLSDVRQAFVRGSRLIADNIGATLPEWSWCDADQATGRKLLVAFNEYYAETHNISEAEACTIVEEIGDVWGLSNVPRELRVAVGNTMARYDLDWSISHEQVQARIDEMLRGERT